jgi:uncharacterized membrane protein
LGSPDAKEQWSVRLQPAAPFDLLALFVSHCMLLGEPDPPQAARRRSVAGARRVVTGFQCDREARGRSFRYFPEMTRGRLEAFSDGVIAIILTIMVLELHPPAGRDLAALRPLLPKLLSYVLSYVFIAIYWNNHHHLMHAVQRVNGRVLWANVHLLFWLSLVPFATAWLGEHGAGAVPVALYGGVLLASGTAYFILTRSLLALHPPDSALAQALGDDLKGKLSVAIYAVSIPLAFMSPALSIALFVVVAGIWLVPDLRFERVLERERR